MFYLWFFGEERPWRHDLTQLVPMNRVAVHVLDYTKRVTPGHEALWVFLQGVVLGQGGVMSFEERLDVVQLIGPYLARLRGKTLTIATERECIFIERMLKRCLQSNVWPWKPDDVLTPDE